MEFSPQAIANYKQYLEETLPPAQDTGNTPDEVTLSNLGGHCASFPYYRGIEEAKLRGLKKDMNTNPGNYMVCCGDVMFMVRAEDYPEVERRAI